MSLKIGIVTFYHNSLNYGGNLQAYALCKYLNNIGFEAEQIRFLCKNHNYSNDNKQNKLHEIKNLIDLRIRQNKSARYIRNNKEKHEEILTERKKAFGNDWHDLIPHSEKVYTEDDITECNDRYDIFVAGSDQIWNPRWYNPIYYLKFCVNKRKVSYAASIPLDHLDATQEKIIREGIKEFEAISVRESSSVNLLQKYVSVPVKSVLDPVFLLDNGHWENLATEKLIDDKYIFCYFLGKNKKNRDIANKFAKENKLKIVMIPYAYGNLQIDDIGFGDICLKDISPIRFLALIQHAEYVLTDSFHATAFSIILGKQFFVFNRNVNNEMNERIESILRLINCENRFCKEKRQQNIKYMKDITPIDYITPMKNLEEQRKESMEFIGKALTVDVS